MLENLYIFDYYRPTVINIYLYTLNLGYTLFKCVNVTIIAETSNYINAIKAKALKYVKLGNYC